MLPLLKHSFTRRIFNTLAFELVTLIACFFLLIVARDIWWHTDKFALNPATVDARNLFLTALFAVSNTLVVQFSLWSFGLYSREVIYSGTRVFSNLINSFIFSAVLLLPICYLFTISGKPIFAVTLKFYLFALLGFMTLITVERTLVLKLFNDAPYLGNILILGTGAATDQVVKEARRHHGKTLQLVGVLSENPDEIGKSVDGCKVIGCIEEIAEIVTGCDIRCILISMPIYSSRIPTEFLLKCKLRGILVIDSAEFYETLGKKVLLEKLDPIQLLLSENLLMTRFRWLLKGSSEKLIAILALLLASPVLIAAAILIKMTSPGSVLYRQDRVGKDGKVFKLLKFRSMVSGAEKNGAVWASINDPRVTNIGKILRKFRIDEAPQLFNVLKGDMAIIGPRPERPEFVERLVAEIPFYNNRHLVPPGITGWAQVVYPYGATIEDAREKLRYDLYYIKHMSFFFDGMIVLSTFRTVLFAKGSR